MNKINDAIDKTKKGCDKVTEWDGMKYHCGTIEDLKHSDHIIYCNNCKEKLKALEFAKKTKLKNQSERISISPKAFEFLKINSEEAGA
ncbi:MAG: hypothetical protein KKE05_06255 [Nanoarchaeota archaeon]|nr:hypothetical protein [Nanoarchaeota archaeon]